MYGITTIVFLIVLHLHPFFIHALPTEIIAQMPKECLGRSYCMTKATNYPHEQIKELLLKMNLRDVEQDPVVSGRSGVDEIEQICERQIMFDPIYEIVDDKDDVRFVVQIENKFIQKHRIVECINPGRVTGLDGRDVFLEDKLMEFNVTCMETRLRHKFLVLGPNNSLEIAKPREGIPVYCSCRYSRSSDELSQY